MMQDYNFASQLTYDTSKYRERFLLRKRVNGYKKNKKGTPELIDKLINSFDRKIKGVSIFTDDIKLEYFRGLKEVFSSFYEDSFIPKTSKKDCYRKYLAVHSILRNPFDKRIGCTTYPNYRNSNVMSFEEFKRTRLYLNYRK